MERGEEKIIGVEITECETPECEMPAWDGSWGDEVEILRRADEEGRRGMSFYDLFRLSVARRREEARRERGLEPLYQPRERKNPAEPEEPDGKPVRNIPLGPPRKGRG